MDISEEPKQIEAERGRLMAEEEATNKARKTIVEEKERKRVEMDWELQASDRQRQRQKLDTREAELREALIRQRG